MGNEEDRAPPWQAGRELDGTNWKCWSS